MVPVDFKWRTYLRLNPDLKYNTEAQAVKHWNEVGVLQKRLYHDQQLVVVNEFGYELVMHVCYYYYLFKAGLLFDNVITTYSGMKPIYFFLPDHQVLEQNRPRRYTPINDRPILGNQEENQQDFDYRYWKPPPYKEYFANTLQSFHTSKPLLVIHNKYVTEWGRVPVNYISVAVLDRILTRVTPKYTVVYIRPVDKNTTRGFSLDTNKEVAGLRDFELIAQKYTQVITFERLLNQFPRLNYNKLKLALYARCDRFIQVQGGGSFQAAFFGGKQLVLHKIGPQLERGCYRGWYRKCSNPAADIVVAQTDEALLDGLAYLLV